MNKDINETVYCRFCVTPKHTSKIIYLESDLNEFDDITKKISKLACFVDFSSSILPKTVCSSCYKALTRACDFIQKIEHSQEILNKIFGEIALSHTFASYLPKIKRNGKKKTKEDVGKEIYNENNNYFNKSIEINTETASPLVTDSPLRHNDCIAISDESNCDNNSSFQNSYEEDNSITKNVFNTDTDNDSDTRVEEEKTWDSYIWLCKHCSNSQNSLQALKEHSREAHGKCYGFTCIDCSLDQNNFGEFIDHVIQHRQYLTYVFKSFN